jgi:hypothetical protein
MEGNNNIETKRDLYRILDKFLVDNTELEELSAKLSIFNIFKVLRIEEAEIRHSNVMAWLLNPQGSHGLGQAFLRRFLSTLLLDNESTIVNVNPAHIELMDMRDVEVWRERLNIDLLASSASNQWVFLVENKIKAKATKRQLLKYIEIVKREFPEFKIIPILLTLEEEENSETLDEVGYIGWSHSQMYHVLNHVVNQRQDRIPHDAKIFLDHYLVVLRRLTMQDEEIVKLCKEIYRKHKDAIDLILEWGATTQFGTVAESFMMDNNSLLKLCLRPNSVWFIPKVWKKNMPPCSNRWKFLSDPYPIACWFNFRLKRSKIGFIIEIGSMEDSKKRLKLVNAFKESGFNIGKMAFRPESKYSRVHSTYRNIADIDDQDEIRKLVDELWIKSKPKINTATKIIESFKWE